MSTARRLMPWFRRPANAESASGLYDSVEMFVDDDGDIPAVARAVAEDPGSEAGTGPEADAGAGVVADEGADVSVPAPNHHDPSAAHDPSNATATSEAMAADIAVDPEPQFTVEVIPGVVAMPSSRRRPRWFDRAAQPESAADIFRFEARSVPTRGEAVDIAAEPTPEPTDLAEQATHLMEPTPVVAESDVGQPVDLTASSGADPGWTLIDSGAVPSASPEVVADDAYATVVPPDPSALVAETFADLAAVLTAMTDQVAEIEREIDAGEAGADEPDARHPALAPEPSAEFDAASSVDAGPEAGADAGPAADEVASADVSTTDASHTATSGAPSEPILPRRDPATKTRSSHPRRQQSTRGPNDDSAGDAGGDEPDPAPNEADRAWDRVAAVLNDDIPTRTVVAAPAPTNRPTAAASVAAGALLPTGEATGDSTGGPTGEAMFSVRGAAQACAITPGSIRHHLRSGSFPRAARSDTGEWQIPFGDLERAGLDPIGPARLPVVPAMSSALEKFGEDDAAGASSDALIVATYARLRAEFAEAYANVQAERLMAEAEKWQMVAEERDRSLQRADEALKTVGLAVESAARLVRAAAGLPDQPSNPAPGHPAAAGTVRFGAKVPPPAPQNTPPNATFVAVPDHVRDEARRLADALHASTPPRRRGRLF
jgi:hypothetical protein